MMVRLGVSGMGCLETTVKTGRHGAVREGVEELRRPRQVDRQATVHALFMTLKLRMGCLPAVDFASPDPTKYHRRNGARKASELETAAKPGAPANFAYRRVFSAQRSSTTS